MSTETAAPARRRFGSPGDMLRSLAVVLAMILTILWLTPRPHGSGAPTIDARPAVQQARVTLSYPVYAPVALEAGWRTTSARTELGTAGRKLWHLGYVTPAGHYAAVEQSDGPQADALGRIAGPGPDARSVVVEGQTWRLRVKGSDSTLWRPAEGSLLAVTGSAPLSELERLAGALRSS